MRRRIVGGDSSAPPARAEVGERLRPLTASGRGCGDAELVALRIGHHNVVPVELLQDDPAHHHQPLRLRLDPRPPLIGTAVSRHPNVDMKPVLRRLRFGDLEDGEAGADAVGVAEPRPVVLGVVLRQVKLREPLLARFEGSRRRLVDIAQCRLPENGEELCVRAIEGQIDFGCQDRTVLCTSDSCWPSPALVIPGFARTVLMISRQCSRNCGPNTSGIHKAITETKVDPPSRTCIL